MIGAAATALAFDLISEPKGNTALETYFINTHIGSYSARRSNSTSGSSFIEKVEPSPLEAELLGYLELNNDWDGYGAKVPCLRIVSSAQKLLRLIISQRYSESLKLTLSGDSEIGLYWDFPELYIELSVDEEGFFSYLINDKANNVVLGNDDLHINKGIPHDVFRYLDEAHTAIKVA